MLFRSGLVALSCPILCNPMDCSLLGSSVHGDSPVKNTGVGCRALLQGIFPTQGSRDSTLQVDSLPSEPPGKPMNTGVGSLSFLRGNLPYPGIKLGSPAFQVDSFSEISIMSYRHSFVISSTTSPMTLKVIHVRLDFPEVKMFDFMTFRC